MISTQLKYFQKIKKSFIILIMLSLFCLNLLQAQESVNTSGGDVSELEGSIAFTIGQVIYTTHMGASGSVACGIQSPFESYPSGINELTMSISLLTFPNPTTDNLTLAISGIDKIRFTYQIFDLQGKLLENGHIKSQRTKIEMSNLDLGTYILRVVDQKNKFIRTFKIVKIQK